MHASIETKRSELADLCRRHHVRRLDLFGSAATGEFVVGTSDLDFLVEFEPLEPVPYKRAYFGLLADLEILLGVPIDLVTVPSLRNPHFIRGVQESRVELYAG